MKIHRITDRLRRGRTSAIAVLGLLATSGVLAGAGLASAKKPGKSANTQTTCEGTAKSPGILTGKVPSNVLVKGICYVDHGSAIVAGSVTVAPGGVLVAAFGRNDKTHSGVSDLTVDGKVVVHTGATAVIGCEAAQFPCIDDSQTSPKLNNYATIGGNLVVTGALGVVVHDTTIDGNVSQSGGGGGENCTPSGPFKAFKSPVYSDYEDDAIGGSISTSNVHSCWLGFQRDYFGKGFTLTNNAMADPDAIEVGHNLINGNLRCTGNTNAVPASAAVWDTSDVTPGALYPRQYKPNLVFHGTRSGQCNNSTPTAAGGPSGAPGSF